MRDEPEIRRPQPRPNPWVRYVTGHARAFAAAGALAVALVVLAIFLLSGHDGDVADPGWLGEDPSGEVVYCSGEDVSGSQARSVEDFNRSRDSGTARARLVDDIAAKAD